MASLFQSSFDTHVILRHFECEFPLVSPLQPASGEHLRYDPCPASFELSLWIIGPGVDHAGRFRVDVLHDEVTLQDIAPGALPGPGVGGQLGREVRCWWRNRHLWGARDGRGCDVYHLVCLEQEARRDGETESFGRREVD